MDDVICNYSEAFNKALEESPKMLFPQSQYGFFANLKPIKKAIESVSKFLASNDYETYFLTAPSIRNPFSYTEKRVWIENHFGYSAVEKMIICSNKGLLKGDILIDDNAHGKGQESFEGRLMHFGSNEFPNWESITNELSV